MEVGLTCNAITGGEIWKMEEEDRFSSANGRGALENTRVAYTNFLLWFPRIK